MLNWLRKQRAIKNKLVFLKHLAAPLLSVEVFLLIPLLRYIAFLREYFVYQKLSGQKLKLLDIYPCLHDKTPASQSGRNYYFYQDIWAMQKIQKLAPARHVDIGSRIDGFVGQLSAFVPVTFIDIRPAAIHLPGVQVKTGSITELPYKDGELFSISALCVIEHIGLGRYGDALDPQGTLKAVKELQRVLRGGGGGNLLVSVPVGRERICFNAQRVFNPQKFVQLFDRCELVEYSVIPEDNKIISNVTLEKYADSEEYTFGLFELRKR